MTQTIEQLQARVAELEAQADPEALHIAYLHGQEATKKQLAAAQADNKRLRDAARYGQLYAPSGSLAQDVINSALAQPYDTSALDAYVAEKVKESHKVVPREGLVPHAYQLEATHNNAEFWYRAGHSEEARAKGESVICMAQAVFAWRNAAYAKAEEIAELTRQRDEAQKAADFNFAQYQDLGVELDKVCRQRDLAVDAATKVSNGARQAASACSKHLHVYRALLNMIDVVDQALSRIKEIGVNDYGYPENRVGIE